MTAPNPSVSGTTRASHGRHTNVPPGTARTARVAYHASATAANWLNSDADIALAACPCINITSTTTMLNRPTPSITSVQPSAANSCRPCNTPRRMGSQSVVSPSPRVASSALGLLIFNVAQIASLAAQPARNITNHRALIAHSSARTVAARSACAAGSFAIAVCSASTACKPDAGMPSRMNSFSSVWNTPYSAASIFPAMGCTANMNSPQPRFAATSQPACLKKFLPESALMREEWFRGSLAPVQRTCAAGG